MSRAIWLWGEDAAKDFIEETESWLDDLQRSIWRASSRKVIHKANNIFKYIESIYLCFPEKSRSSYSLVLRNDPGNQNKSAWEVGWKDAPWTSSACTKSAQALHRRILPRSMRLALRFSTDCNFFQEREIVKIVDVCWFWTCSWQCSFQNCTSIFMQSAKSVYFCFRCMLCDVCLDKGFSYCVSSRHDMCVPWSCHVAHPDSFTFWFQLDPHAWTVNLDSMRARDFSSRQNGK